MSGTSSARPDDLQSFVTEAGQANQTLVSDINRLRQSYDEFQASGSITVANPELMDGALPDLVTTQQTTDSFVSVTRAAFLAADGGSVSGGVVSAADGAVQAAFARAAIDRHLDPEALDATPAAVTVAPDTLGAIPQDSGFVEDPICTATGHFTEVEPDFAMPSRLAVLTWPRMCSSRLLDGASMGPGWWTWADVSLRRTTSGDARLVGPDGRRGVFELVPGGGEVWVRLPGIEAEVQVGEGGALRLCWDALSGWPLQRWSFDAAGRLVEVTGPTIASTRFTYEDHRLVGVEAAGGRSLQVTWEDDLITAVASSDGRSVRYRYEGGQLASADGPAGRRSYTTDERGLIIEVHDADGVRLCHNTYDEEGRVLRQLSPFGRETLLEYLPGRRTRITDTSSGPSALFEHDVIGRVVAITNAEGRSLRRAWDDEGRISSQTSFDGSRLVRVPRPGGASLSTSGGEVETWHYDDRGRVITHERPGGREIRFRYDGDAVVPSSIEDPEGGVQRFDYDEVGLLRRVVDPDGYVATMDYDTSGVLIALHDSAGGTTGIEPGPTGQPSRVVHPDGSVVELGFDGAGRPLSVTDEEGGHFTIQRTAAGRPSAIVDPAGGTTTLEYGSHGDAERIVGPTGGVIELRYDELASLVGITNPDGSKWEVARSLLGQLSMAHAPDGGTWSFGYDPEGRLADHLDPLGNRTRLDHDEAGRLVRVVDPVGGETSFSYDEAGNPISQRDAAGGVTTYEWDRNDRLLARTDPDGATERYRWSPAGRLLAVEVPGQRSTLGYDGAGRVAEVDTGAGSWRYAYDERHRVASVTSPAGRATTYGRDRAGRIVSIDTGGVRTTYAYDRAGRVVRQTDGAGRARTFDHDAAGRLVAARDPLGGEITYGRDSSGNVVEQHDPIGGVVRRTFDVMQRLTSETDQLGRTTSFGYDLAGRVIERAAPTGELLHYRRDARGLLTDIEVDGAETAVYEHDALGRRQLLHEPAKARTETFEWSAGGQLRAWSDGVSTMRWEHDDAGRVVRRVDALGVETVLGYDGAGRLVRLGGDGWAPVSLRRDPDGLLIGIDSDGHAERWVYDGAGQLLVHQVEDGGDAREEVQVWDAAGQLAERTDRSGTTTYGYDGAGRLSTATDAGGTTAWSYDAAGRRVIETGPGGERRWRYDAAHQLVEAAHDGGTTRFTYDARGRRRSEVGPEGRRELRWDGLDHLVGVTVAGPTGAEQVVELDVDPDGVPVAIGGEQVGWDRSAATSPLTSLGDRSLLVVDGRPIASTSGASPTWLDPGGGGSLGARGPWGETSAPSVAPVLGFLGELEVAGLVWLRARAYDPATGQFVSVDPLPGVPGSPAGAWPYQYADDDPLGRVDPLGLRPVSVADLNKARKAATGIQWGHIAAVAGTVAAGVALAALLPESGIVAAAAFGAGLGAANGALPGIVNGLTGKGWNWGSIAKGAIIGGVVGGIAGPVAGALPTEGVAALGSGVALGGVSGAGGTTLGELYDGVPGLPGATGHIDLNPGAIAQGGAEGALESAGGAGISHVAGIGDPSGAGEPAKPPTVPDTPVDPPASSAPPASPPQLIPVKPVIVVPQDPVGYTRSPSGLLVPGNPPGYTHSPSGLYVPSH